MPARLSRSRAFWNLRAEQVMDQVFSQGETTLQGLPSVLDVEVTENHGSQREQRFQRPWLIITSVLAVLGIGASLWLIQNWQRSVITLNRERDLQMIERLRRIPLAPATAETPAATKPTQTTENTTPSTPAPATSTAKLEPLTLPLAGPVPLADTSFRSVDPIATLPAEPLLVGVVYAKGGKGSAIFQLDQRSLSASPGEAIGNSGWRLKAVKASGAVIEHQGVRRTLNVGAAF
ncbi:MAG: hypothetical protein ACON4T_10755 [Synechococcus sp.]